MSTAHEPRGEAAGKRFGDLPAWGRDDLPEPLPFSTRNLFRTIGPGAILLATSIGAGEWVIGPMISVNSGTGIMWVATVAILVQLLFNMEAIRYTLYTGEPMIVGFMRLRPGSSFWASVYSLLTIAQLGLPAMSATCALVLFAAIAGPEHQTGQSDDTMVHLLTYAVILVSVVILLSGRTIERVLEYISWVMVAFIFTFLIAVNVIFVPLGHWVHALGGFFRFGYVPRDVDLLLLGTLAAMAGSGGVGNLVITNWYRDKGFGMGAKVGAIASAFSGVDDRRTFIGKVFDVTAENLARWRAWWRYVIADQVCLWAVGCFVGMYLNVNLATHITPSGMEADPYKAGVFQAQFMADTLWSGFWFLALLNGFWLLFKTNLGDTDILVRTVTDILWIASPKLRARPRLTISRLYYGLLALFTLWFIVGVNWGNALTLFKVMGNVASPVLAFAAIQILLVNTRLLPVELRPRLWRRAALVLCTLFYGTISVVSLADQIRQWLQSASP